MSRDLPLGRRDFLLARLRPVLAGRVAAASAPSGLAAAEESAPAPPWARPSARRRVALPTMSFRATVDRFSCLAGAGQLCSVCVERCPEPGALHLDGLYPVVDGDRCTGCGACEPACPAPSPAIRVLPLIPSPRTSP